ncbi:MAS3 protein [Diaporthe amygdali]|uniref:MAS3 protein n=1 Tax=Phomopsis amygdali TaxID=1214568 RepID=UPI0022FE64EA|nr:MAS3 protein [Diaporthe amygdali]KAJ0119050.1 MAS3 protein [Diaporthe amygdali]
MFSKIFLIALAASPLVAAHGKIAVATGDAGGNSTALGIQGAVIPGAGKNKVTEPDTTVFKGDAADACGRTNGQGDNDIEAGTQAAMALSGNTLAQVTPGGSVSGTLHIVTSDGAGPYKAMLNTDGTGQSWTAMDVETQVPGTKGKIQKSEKRAWARALQAMGIMKRATNINEDYPFKVNMPAGASCTGNIAGQANTCLVKLVNPSNAGPFGGCIPVQMVQPGAAAAAPAAGAATARRMARSFAA